MKSFFKSISDRVKNKFLDLMALIIATAAIIITLKQGESQKELTIANWQPALLIEFIRNDSEPKKGFLLKNVGFGPAVIESFKYFKNEEDYQKGVFHQEWLHPNGFSKALLLGFKFEEINNLTQGFILKNDREENFFLIGTGTEKFYGSATDSSLQDAIIEVEYKSFIGLDKKSYYLRFCDRFIRNNVTEKNQPNIYERKQTNVI